MSQGIDPTEWASLCRYIGKLSPKEFRRVRAVVVPSADGFKRLSDSGQSFGRIVPVVSIGPSGLGGRFQREV